MIAAGSSPPEGQTRIGKAVTVWAMETVRPRFFYEVGISGYLLLRPSLPVMVHLLWRPFTFGPDFSSTEKTLSEERRPEESGSDPKVEQWKEKQARAGGGRWGTRAGVAAKRVNCCRDSVGRSSIWKQPWRLSIDKVQVPYALVTCTAVAARVETIIKKSYQGVLPITPYNFSKKCMRNQYILLSFRFIFRFSYISRYLAPTCD